MVWSWYYLIPIAVMLIVAVIWITVFFMSYKNTKNVKTAIAEAKETIEAFKGDTGMAITARAKLAEQGINVAAVPASEEVTTTPAEPAKAATETTSAPPVEEDTAAAETPVAAEKKAAESIEEKGEKAEIKLIDNLLFMAVEKAIDDMTDETEIKKLLNKLASKLA